MAISKNSYFGKGAENLDDVYDHYKKADDEHAEHDNPADTAAPPKAKKDNKEGFDMNGNMAANKFDVNTSSKAASRWLTQTKMPDNAVFKQHNIEYGKSFSALAKTFLAAEGSEELEEVEKAELARSVY